MMSMNSKNSTNHSNVSDQIRTLVLDYMTAYGDGEHELAEKLLNDIRTIKKLCPDSPDTTTTD
jgi:hypothetical protein